MKNEGKIRAGYIVILGLLMIAITVSLLFINITTVKAEVHPKS